MHDLSSEIWVTSSTHKYEIKTSSRFIDQKFPMNSIFISDSRFHGQLTFSPDKTIFIDAIEPNKSLETCVQVLIKLQELGANKNTQLVAIGGGIVQDVVTLVASLYMRGISWIYFPTTKMSQLDSCIGGKSSINLNGKKNLVGNIYPPKAIHIDFSFNSTLTKPSLASGYLEAIKISFAHSMEGFSQHLKLAQNYSKIEKISELELNRLVLTQKKYFVENDEFDSGIRQLLNFGHTFGHALEAASRYEIQHGVAVGIGMLMALRHPEAEISHESELLEEAVWKIIKFAGYQSICAIESVAIDSYINAFLSDKKHRDGNYTVIVPRKQGLDKLSAVWNEDSFKLTASILTQIKQEILHEVQ